MMQLHPLTLAATALTTVLLVGCEKKAEPVTLPEANAESCKPENIVKLDKSAQEAFSSQCLRLGEFKPSPARNW